MLFSENPCRTFILFAETYAFVVSIEFQMDIKSKWILVEEPQTNEALEVLSGKVRYHSRDRDEIYRKAVKLRPKRFAMIYTGTIPEDTAIVL